MGTRSRIGIMHGDVCKSVYCHWDGYLAHNGQILFDHYDSTKTNQLVSLGDISSLGPEIGTKHDFDAPVEGQCTFYGRDRGETGVDWLCHQDFKSFIEHCYESGVEYYYIMKDDVWYVGDTYADTVISNRLSLLSAVLSLELNTPQ